MKETADLIELLTYKFEEQEIPYLLVHRPFGEGTGWCIRHNVNHTSVLSEIAAVISDMSDDTGVGFDDIIAALSEYEGMYNEEKRNKKDIKETQKKICPLCSMNYGEGEDYCGYGDTCELIKRIREGKQA